MSYWDSSALVKLYVKEADSANLMRWRCSGRW